MYVNFRKYDDLKAQSRALWAFVDANPVKKIAIDIRLNGGGDFNVGRRYIVDELARRPKLRGFVLVGPHTFSAALMNAIDLREIAGDPAVASAELPTETEERSRHQRPFAVVSSAIQTSDSTCRSE